jgi:hypothetical protein
VSRPMPNKSAQRLCWRERGRRGRRVAFCFVATCALAAAAVIPPSLASGRRASGMAAAGVRTSPSPTDTLAAKIEELSLPANEQPKSFKPIVITEVEANSFLKEHGADFLPPAVEDPEIHIHPDHVSAVAEVDFDKLQQIGKQSNDVGAQVLAALFKGKQKVSASGKLETSDGHGQVSVENLTIGTTAIPDWMTKLMIENYLQQNYKVDLSKPFPLPDHVTRIELGSGQATFIRSPHKKPPAHGQPSN